MKNFKQLVYPNLKVKELGGYIIVGGISGVIGIYLTYLMGNFFDVIITSQNKNVILKFIVIYISMSMINKACCVLMEYQNLSIETSLVYRLTQQVLNKIYHTSYLNYCKKKPASISQEINNDSSVIADFYISFFKNSIVQTISLVVYFLVLVRNSVFMGLLVILMIGAYTCIYLFTKKAIYRAGKEVIERKTQYATTLFNFIEKSLSIRLNGMKDYHLKNITCDFGKLLHALKKQIAVYNIYGVSRDLLVLIFQSALFIVGGRMIQMGRMTVGTLIVMLNYFVYALGCIEFFLNIGSSYQSVKASEDRLEKYISFEEIETGKKIQEKIVNIKLEKLSFAYPGKNILFEITKEFCRGKIYWVKGRNGAGKSSFMNLMLGVYGNSYKGEIRYNNIKMEELDIEWFIKENTAVIEQKPYIFDGTVRENIFLKADEANEKNVKELIHKMKLEQLLDSAETDNVQQKRSMIYSGGEMQKIALVRLLLSDACIWILDEPTSNLDEESRINFYQELERRKKEHIIFLISHEKPQCQYDNIVDIGDIYSGSCAGTYFLQ